MPTDWLKAFPPEPAPDSRGPRRIPKRKRKPGKKSAYNRNVGKLAGIMKVPLDIFYEVRRTPSFRRLGRTLCRLCYMQIVSYMHPSDLLHISRVSKHFGSMLMTRNAVSFWRAARRTIDMPDPPPDFNDAQYIALIFEHVCNVR